MRPTVWRMATAYPLIGLSSEALERLGTGAGTFCPLAWRAQAPTHARHRGRSHRRNKPAAHRSTLRSETPMPMARDVDTPAEPHGVVPSHVLEELDEPSHTPGAPDQPIVQPDREQLGRTPDALAIEH